MQYLNFYSMIKCSFNPCNVEWDWISASKISHSFLSNLKATALVHLFISKYLLTCLFANTITILNLIMPLSSAKISATEWNLNFLNSTQSLHDLILSTLPFPLILPPDPSIHRPACLCICSISWSVTSSSTFERSLNDILLHELCLPSEINISLLCAYLHFL